MGESAAAAPSDWTGTARYEVIGRLGQGGMGVVYEAFDRERRHLVAVKKLLRYDAAGLYLFKQEFRTLADVRHTNLVHLYELVVDGEDDVFFTMELVRGADFLRYSMRASGPRLSAPPATFAAARSPADKRDDDGAEAPSSCRRRTPLPAQSPADIERLRPALRQLVKGIQALHSAGKLHRDVKPSNVLVTPEGRVVLLDFGVATELRGRAGEVRAGSGEVVGTARYMAPEQADDEAPMAASDWYSVGVMLYEALVGRPPFVGSAVDVLTMKSMMDARPPSECVGGVPPDLDALCVALLSRNPSARPEGAEILRGLGVTRSSAPPPPLAAAASSSAFIGREAHLDALRAAYEASRSGRLVTVRVGGASGMGKSTLVHHFLDRLVRDEDAIVLRGRAYEREAVPYKAVDILVDSLSRHLMHVMDDQAPPALPADTWLLARLFPVLKRVAAVEAMSPMEADDPQGVRQRAFVALRELLALVAARRPLVLFVDDAQWGDVDSAALLLDLLRPPEAPALLLLMTYRDNEERTSPFLTELRERWPEGADLRDLKVEPLQDDDALLLAMTLFETRDELGKRTARAVARESRGNPFLIEELVRSNRGASSASGATLAVLTLDQMIAERLDRLPEPARRFVEIAAVGGRPLPVSAVADAAAVRDTVNEIVGSLSARRFLRVGLRDARDVVETVHDRIRETIVAQLAATTLCAYHERLAHALEDVPGSDAEAVALHWLGAGDTERAARFAEGAAEQAASKLAFEQAARLYRLTLEHLPARSPDEPRIRARLAEALRFAGRREESARAYMAAAEGAAPAQRLEFQRAASEQLLFGGRIDEGTEILHRVLAAVGMTAPRTPVAAVFWLVMYRLWLAVIGLRFKERDPGEVPGDRRLRIDALATVAMGFSLVDVIFGACMQARHLIEALRAGDRFQVARAMSLEAGHVAAAGGRQSSREQRLVETAASLTDKEDTLEARAFFGGGWGVGLFLRGRWREANPLLDRAGRSVSVSGFEISRLFELYTHLWMGELREVWKRTTRVSTMVEEQGDLYTLVNLRTTLGIVTCLAAGDPARARRTCANALAVWTQSGFRVQHWQAMVYGAEIDLYDGDAERAYQAFVAAMPAVRRSLLLHTGFVRALTWSALGRLALASSAARPELRRARIAEARRMVRKLDREHDGWVAGIARALEASLENAAGNRDAAIAALRAGLERLEATGTLLYVLPARYRLGQLLGGEEGEALRRSALDDLVGQGVREPERWVQVYLPGNWSGPPEKGPGGAAENESRETSSTPASSSWRASTRRPS